MSTGNFFSGVQRQEREAELYLHSRICLYGVVLRYLSVGTIIPLP
jgi:hypothetical protein